MLFNKIFSIKKFAFATLILLLTAFVVAGCQPAAPATEGEHEAEHEAEHESDHEVDHEHESDDEHGDRVPNDGAIIRIISPEDGASFASGEDIVVEVEVENFDLNEEGNHWHLYVDGSVLNMVAGGVEKSVIHALEPGEHEIDVYLGLTTHEELEEGDSITITVTE